MLDREFWKPYGVYVLAVVAFVAAWLVVANRVDASSRTSTACIYEILAKGDSLVVGWAPSCTPPVDVRTEEHEYLLHWVLGQPCGVVGVFILPDVMTPVVDTFPKACAAKTPPSTF